MNYAVKTLAVCAANVQALLARVHLPRYADEVTMMLPENRESAQRFIYWAEAFAATFDQWCAHPHVAHNLNPHDVALTRTALVSLVDAARAVRRSYC